MEASNSYENVHNIWVLVFISVQIIQETGILADCFYMPVVYAYPNETTVTIRLVLSM